MKRHIVTLLLYVVTSGLGSFVVGWLIGPDEELTPRLGRAVFMGVVLGVIFFLLDNHKKSRRP